MIIGIRKHWMEGHQALNHRVRKKRKGNQRKKIEIKIRKSTRRNPNIAIFTTSKAKEGSDVHVC